MALRLNHINRALKNLLIPLAGARSEYMVLATAEVFRVTMISRLIILLLITMNRMMIMTTMVPLVLITRA